MEGSWQRKKLDRKFFKIKKSQVLSKSSEMLSRKKKLNLGKFRMLVVS